MLTKLSTAAVTSLAAFCFASCCPPKKVQVADTTPKEPVSEPQPTPEVKPAPPVVDNTAKPQMLVFPEEAFRAKQPDAGPQRDFALPKINAFSLKNGIKAYLVEKHDLPIVSIDLSFEGGSVGDPKGKKGLASICMGLVSEGTSKLDKVAFSEALGDLASEVSSYSGPETVGISMQTLSKNLGETFALYADVLTSAGLREADFTRLVKRSIEGIKQAKGSPDGILSRVSPRVTYGEAHPFGAVATEASLAAITLDDCKAYYARAIKPQGANLFVVGDMTEAQVRELFEASPALAAWKGTGIKRAKTPALPKPERKVFFVHVPGAAQSQVALIGPGPKRIDKDFFANQLMIAVFGGGFTSRINMNLREDKGYSYGARGSFNYTRELGSTLASASVRTDSSFQSLLEMQSEYTSLATGAKPVTEEELGREKNGIVLALPGRFATGSSSLGQFRNLVYFGLPLDYMNSFASNVTAVTMDQVKAAAKKQLNGNSMSVLVIGDGDAKMIQHNAAGKKDEPWMKDGKPVTLRDALVDLANASYGKRFIELDADAALKK